MPWIRSANHPEWGEDKFAEEFAAKFGILHSESTIRRVVAECFRYYNGARPSCRWIH